MKNGFYEMVVAPEDYPGKKYRGRYVYEHHLVYWRRTGKLVSKGFLLHHKDENKRHNVFRNLELKSWSKHSIDHAKRAKPKILKCSWCCKEFEIAARNFRFKWKRGQRRFYCCRSHQVMDQQRMRRSEVGIALGR